MLNNIKSYYQYLHFNNADLFTIILLPNSSGKFPTVIFRCPYVDDFENKSEQEAINYIIDFAKEYLINGYAVVYQHCRGCGKSSGDCIPYINEKEDGLFLQDWIRKQPFYNKELYLIGGSYLSSVHLLTYPFAKDIKGAVLEIQDSSRYNCNYRNGFFKIGLHGNWYVSMYKRKTFKNKNFNENSYKMLPLINFSKEVFNEEFIEFDNILLHPNKDDSYWKSIEGGSETINALKHANIPILLTTSWYDIYTGGIFDMWNYLDDNTKNKSSLIVHAYDHDGSNINQDIIFEKGAALEQFNNYRVAWLNHIRNNEKLPFEIGKVNYYRLFDNKWTSEDFKNGQNSKTFILGNDIKSYVYNPKNPCVFKGGLSTNFGGGRYQNLETKEGIITIYTEKFTNDTFVKGKMKAKLNVSSDCEDTCFYIRLSICKNEGDFGLRDDINQISNFVKDYKVNDFIDIDFNFDEHAFLVKKGERIRIDISSSAYPFYVPHTNIKGLYSLIDNYKIATNKIDLSKSTLTIYYE